MSATLLEKAPAKINLTLRVLGRRVDGYHEIESLVAFADFGDMLTLRTDAEEGLEITGPFGGKSGPITDNLVLKAVAAGRERVAGLQAGRFLLEKNIPVAAGLGGGSADAAAALRLVARVNAVSLDDPILALAARATGADVPVCLHPRARIMRGVGERLSEPVKLPALPALLVNPLVPLATRDVFGRFAGARGGSLAD
ncbi:MAG: 4-(cytidine 5'-diphospho)-2-C-methyl-D-erythritol kinase, partial [Pseudolabrys sp.]